MKHIAGMVSKLVYVHLVVFSSTYYKLAVWAFRTSFTSSKLQTIWVTLNIEKLQAPEAELESIGTTQDISIRQWWLVGTARSKPI